MNIEAVSPTTRGLAGLQAAHGSMNAAYNALAMDRDKDPIGQDIDLARGYVREATQAIATAGGNDGLTDAMHASRAVLPRLERALMLLDALGMTPDPAHVATLLDEIGTAMTHVEEVLAGAGWD